MEHQHHHEHEGCCHHHGHELGEQIVHSAFTFSREGMLSGAPVTLEQAAQRVEQALLEAAELLAFEGMVPGHVKALIQGETCHCVLSVTRTDQCDRTGPVSSGIPEKFRLTVNLISAIPPETSPESAVSRLFE